MNFWRFLFVHYRWHLSVSSFIWFSENYWKSLPAPSCKYNITLYVLTWKYQIIIFSIRHYFKKNYCNKIIVIVTFAKLQTFAIGPSYYWYLNICIHNLQLCYEASRQDKKEESLDIIKVLVSLCLLLRFMWLQLLQGCDIFC